MKELQEEGIKRERINTVKNRMKQEAMSDWSKDKNITF